MKKQLFLLILTTLMLQGLAQESGMIFNSKLLPQKSNINPSFTIIEQGWYLTLPNFFLEFENPFSYNQVFQRVDDNTIRVNTDKFLNAIKKNDAINVNVNVGLIGFGINWEKSFFNFSTKFRMDVESNLPYDLFAFLLQGNVDYQYRDALLVNEDFMNLTSYMEYAFGYGHRFLDKKLTVGARVKLLQGTFNLSTQGTHISVYSDPDIIRATADYKVRFAANNNKLEDISKVSPFTGNTGFAFDLGMNYKIIPKLEVSAAVTDIGWISWSDNVTEYRSRATNQLEFTGLEWEDMWSNNTFNTSFFQQLYNSIENMFDYIEDSAAPKYKTRLTTHFNVGARYDINKQLGVSALYKGEFGEFDYRYIANLGLSYNPFKWCELMIGNSIVNGTFFNPGFGVNATILGTVQFYFVLDYISNFYLADSHSVCGQLGLNLTFKKERKPKAPVPDDDFMFELF
jgi:hypothetical protein